MKKGFVYIFLFTLLTVPTLEAESIFASKGLGLPYQFPTTRAMGLGGTILAFNDAINSSDINPATLSSIQFTNLSIQYIHELNTAKDADYTHTTDYGNLHSFNFNIPTGENISVGASIRPLTRTDYYLDLEITDTGLNYSKTIKSSGGLNRASLSIAWGLHPKVQLGLSGHYFFGTFTENWSVKYGRSGFTDSQDEYVTGCNGFGTTLGLLFKPLENLTIGAVYSPAAKLSTETQLESTFNDTLTSTEGNISYPASWGLGFAYSFVGIGHLGLDITSQAWDNLKINDKTSTDVNATLSYAAGFEFLKSENPYASYLRRTAYRIGSFRTALPMRDKNGDAIIESGLSMGLGLPMLMNRARIDLSFAISKRGKISASDLEETIYRFSVEVIGTEKWFQRRY